MDSFEDRVRNPQQRGVVTSAAALSRRFRISAEEAERIFRRFGPYSINLDVLMKAKGHQPISDWEADV